MRWWGRVLLLACGVYLVACQTPDRYRWAGYEDSVFNVTVNAGEVDVQAEIAHVIEWLQRAEDSSQLIPPGMHAHLGLLYSLAGDTVNAAAAFNAEKQLYPESTGFIDGVLARAKLES